MIDIILTGKIYMKSKNIKLDDELVLQVETLCDILHTNFSVKAKELLVEWKIKELKRLREDAPEIYQQYQTIINKQ